MSPHKRKFISLEEEAYVKLLIANPESENKKVGLETLCKLYRSSLVLRNSYIVVLHTVALLYDDSPRVRRWALNALALIGSNEQVVAILEAIKRNQQDPDVLAAGISALSSILTAKEAKRALAKAGLPLEGAIVLAASQHSRSFEKELRRTRVNIDKADVAELRLSGILVGLGKAPENLFTLKFPNSKVIGELNHHPDEIVAQYSVWAALENPALGPKALGVNLKEIEFRPEKVRKYVYQTIANDAPYAVRHYDLLVQGSEDKSIEARTGLAIGLRNTYFDSADQLILEWYLDEEVEAVRQRLLEHMATNSDKCPSYEKHVLKSYRDANRNFLTRSRLESAARDTDLHTKMRIISHNAEGEDLFGFSFVPRRTIADEAAKQSADAAMSIKTLLVTALPKEAAAVKATFDSRRPASVAGDSTLYEVGTFKTGNVERSVLFASTGMGTLNASVLATNALRTFKKLEHIIMIGIAGGCPNELKSADHVRLGDVVFSGSGGIIAYDYVKETIDGKEIRAFPQRPSAAMLKIAEHLQAEELIGSRPWDAIAASALKILGEQYTRPSEASDVLHRGTEIVSHPQDPERSEGLPRIFSGVIGAADTLQKDPATRDQLRDRFGVRAIEMEASGLQNAAWHQGKDIFVVRGICDYCDHAKNDDWQKYAALAAAAYARAMIETMPIEWF